MTRQRGPRAAQLVVLYLAAAGMLMPSAAAAQPLPSIQVEPRSVSLSCAGSFEIEIANSGPEGSVLEIRTLFLHHGYSQGDYGTGFTWDTDHITLPASLPSGTSFTIPVSYSAAGQSFRSRLHLQVESNAENEPDVFLTYFGALCATPTATPAPPTPTPFSPRPGDLGFTTQRGRVFDARLPDSAAIPGAVVSFTRVSYFPDPGPFSGVTQTDANGHFSFSIFVHDTDLFTFKAEAEGFEPAERRFGGVELWFNYPEVELALHPLSLETETITPTASPTSTTSEVPAPTQTPEPSSPCIGDCDANLVVAVGELVTAVNIALGEASVTECRAADHSDNGEVTIEELIAAVRNALSGCPAGTIM